MICGLEGSDLPPLLLGESRMLLPMLVVDGLTGRNNLGMLRGLLIIVRLSRLSDYLLPLHPCSCDNDEEMLPRYIIVTENIISQEAATISVRS